MKKRTGSMINDNYGNHLQNFNLSVKPTNKFVPHTLVPGQAGRTASGKIHIGPPRRP